MNRGDGKRDGLLISKLANRIETTRERMRGLRKQNEVSLGLGDVCNCEMILLLLLLLPLPREGCAMMMPKTKTPQGTNQIVTKCLSSLGSISNPNRHEQESFSGGLRLCARNSDQVATQIERKRIFDGFHTKLK